MFGEATKRRQARYLCRRRSKGEDREEEDMEAFGLKGIKTKNMPKLVQVGKLAMKPQELFYNNKLAVTITISFLAIVIILAIAGLDTCSNNSYCRL